MARSRGLLMALTGLVLSLSMAVTTGMTAQAGKSDNYLSELNGGVAVILEAGTIDAAESINATAR